MSKMNQVFITLSLLALALAGCSAKVDGGSGALPTDLRVGTGTAAATVLEGNWATGCVGSGGVYLTANITFSGNTNSGTMKLYADSACTQLVQQQTQSGTFTIGSASSVAGATNIDYLSSTGASTYDIFEINGSNVYFGTNPGTTPATRSSQLNTDLPFSKSK